ncbi:MAG TPA: S8/S53 family peptidase [Gammaproteobacteria bacterium]|nr:S8/S53 family peptidase [Gammaproteobacteria bacterium]
MRLIRALALSFCLSIPLPAAAQDGRSAQTLLEFAAASCRDWESAGAPAAVFGDRPFEVSDIVFRGQRIGSRHRLEGDTGWRVEFEVIEPGGRPTRFIASTFNSFGDPLLLMVLDRECSLQVARRIDYGGNGQALQIETLNAGLEPTGEPDLLNPPLIFVDREAPTAQASSEAAPLRVGMIDSGVNYRVPEINRRLARDRDGELIGYDFWDMDAQPYDAQPVDSGFFVQRHGTRTASLLLREAPMVELVPYRYPRPDMSRMRALIEHAADNDVGILGMPLGSNSAEDWGEFARAARAHPRMLFVASAGNDGRDIDEQPVYPASLGLDNLIVVTSADDFLRPAERTNWGRISVDFMVPAENVVALDYSGEHVQVSGSSFAVSRVVALAAGIKAARRDLGAAEIVAELRRHWVVDSEVTRRWVGGGYIADPLAGGSISRRSLPPPRLGDAPAEAGLRLPLELLVLDEQWSEPRIAAILRTAFGVLEQCGIAAGDLSLYAVDAPDYLRDLGTGTARTLLEAAGGNGLTVVLARDTLMQEAYTGEAFGLGNTSMRPWLANSVWLMLDVDDAGIALAHELYHVLANSGEHIAGTANLMQARTHPESSKLTPQQCQLARDNGIANHLLYSRAP